MTSSLLNRAAITLAASAIFAGTCAAQTTQDSNNEIKQRQRIELRAAAGGGGFGGRRLDEGDDPCWPMRKEKAAYLGVVTAPVTAALREQLKLKPGVGLVVESVQKDSPAEAAGIKQYDVMDKLDDQWLINSQQLAVLVRMHTPGDQIAVSVVRQGQPQTINAKLVEKELAVMDDANPWGVPGRTSSAEHSSARRNRRVQGPDRSR